MNTPYRYKLPKVDDILALHGIKWDWLIFPPIIAMSQKLYVGKFGSEEISKLLSTTEEPFSTIKEIQDTIGLPSVTPSCEPKVFAFSDLCGINRPTLYHKILLKMQEKLLDALSTASNEELEKLLEDSFKYIEIDELKSIPLNILAKIERIPDKFLQKLAEMEHIFNVGNDVLTLGFTHQSETSSVGI